MPRYPFSGPERQEAAREAVELQEGEKKAEGLLMPPAAVRDVAQMQSAGGDLMPPAAIGDVAQTQPAGGEEQQRGPENLDLMSPQQATPTPRQTTLTPGQREILEQTGAETWGAREEHLTRDRSDLPLPQMSLQALKDARERLVVALATEPSGSQADAYTVLMGRIDREIAEQETPVAVTEEPAVEEQ